MDEKHERPCRPAQWVSVDPCQVDSGLVECPGEQVLEWPGEVVEQCALAGFNVEIDQHPGDQGRGLDWRAASPAVILLRQNTLRQRRHR